MFEAGFTYILSKSLMNTRTNTRETFIYKASRAFVLSENRDFMSALYIHSQYQEGYCYHLPL